MSNQTNVNALVDNNISDSNVVTGSSGPVNITQNETNGVRVGSVGTLNLGENQTYDFSQGKRIIDQSHANFPNFQGVMNFGDISGGKTANSENVFVNDERNKSTKENV
ncbi:uncharacterized protein LOC143460313 [Clavelina lepadiformis]|uniref:uncharacterized protein LOC143460313 n=1 Tax=Clavelina lepadiformis TaxID=159417 RepID=UPI0040435B9F